MQTGLYVFLGLVALYVVFVVWLVQSKRLEKWNLSLMLGIVLMVRTQKGKATIDFIARPRRLWNVVGDAGIVLTLVGMLVMTLFIIFSASLVLQPNSPVPALGPTEILVIPGVTPFVPLGYGLLALIVTLVVHEGGHGVLARANGMKLKAIGLLVAVVPIGAFVEPDDLDMKVASRRQRLRVFGAGPSTNFAFAAICLTGFALMMGALAPLPAAHVANIVQGGPAEAAGVQAGQSIAYARADHGDWQRTTEWPELQAFINTAKPGDRIHLALLDGSEHNLTLSSKWDGLTAGQQASISGNRTEGMAFCKDVLEPDPSTGDECYLRLIRAPRMGISFFLPENFAPLANPLGQHGLNMLTMITLPVVEISGSGSYLNLYVPSFYQAPFSPPLFWTLANTLFWIFWINIAVGLTNILPMLPLDGGHIFRDAVGGVYQKFMPNVPTEHREKLVGRTAGTMSLVILAAFLLQIFGPHLRNWLG